MGTTGCTRGATRVVRVGVITGLLGLASCTQASLSSQASGPAEGLTDEESSGKASDDAEATAESAVTSEGADGSSEARAAGEANSQSGAAAGSKTTQPARAMAAAKAGQGDGAESSGTAATQDGSDGQPPMAADAAQGKEDCGCEDLGVLKAQLGDKLFEDKTLSASGTLSCAGCHASEQAHAGNNNKVDPLFPVATGAFEDLVGGRNAPTARYMAFSPQFQIAREIDEDADGAVEYVPVGGQFWDGRAPTLEAQALGPFLNPSEMALTSPKDVVERVRNSDYAGLFKRVFGDNAFDDEAFAFSKIGEAIAAYERSDELLPFDSKFDAVLRGQAQLNEQEALGFALFSSPEKGNCIACHAGVPGSKEPRDWLFTDFTYDNLGVPRNTRIPANQDSEFVDLGLCKQPGLRERVPMVIEDKDAYVQSLCGAFKVPTLRNVEVTAPYMHNGVFADLRDVVEFYVTRDTNPGKWYPHNADGSVIKFNDLPPDLHANVNTTEAPLDRHESEQPRMNDAEIDAVVAFLRTLTDGYKP